jgi:hypothetical protein
MLLTPRRQGAKAQRKNREPELAILVFAPGRLGVINLRVQYLEAEDPT